MSIDIKELKHGDMISCRIRADEEEYERETKIEKATIYKKEEEKLYICQNIAEGANAPDKMGYMYSWVVREGDNEDDISEIEFLDNNYKTIILEDYNKYKIAKRIKKTII